MVRIYSNEVVVFDLDDLLYNEFDYVRSGFWKVARTVEANDPKKLFMLMMSKYFSGEPVFDWLHDEYLVHTNHTKKASLEIYRNHKPEIKLSWEARALLEKLKRKKHPMGIITDGRSVTQRNKIEALKLNRYTSHIIISEEFGEGKPSEKPFKYFMQVFGGHRYVYIGDNYRKDFIAPNRLGWRTIALADNGLNVNYGKEGISQMHHPRYIISGFNELILSAKPLHDSNISNVP